MVADRVQAISLFFVRTVSASQSPIASYEACRGDAVRLDHWDRDSLPSSVLIKDSSPALASETGLRVSQLNRVLDCSLHPDPDTEDRGTVIPCSALLKEILAASHIAPASCSRLIGPRGTDIVK